MALISQQYLQAKNYNYYGVEVLDTAFLIYFYNKIKSNLSQFAYTYH